MALTLSLLASFLLEQSLGHGRRRYDLLSIYHLYTIIECVCVQILEKKAFDEINAQSPIDSMTMGSSAEAMATSPVAEGGWLRRVFKWKRSVSHV